MLNLQVGTYAPQRPTLSQAAKAPGTKPSPLEGKAPAASARPQAAAQPFSQSRFEPKTPRPDARPASAPTSPDGFGIYKKELGVTIHPLTTQTLPNRIPTVFFNYDETLTQGELGQKEFTTIGARPEKPGTQRFVLAGAHANGSAHSSLQVGASFTNTASKKDGKPLVLRLTNHQVAKDGGAPMDPTQATPKGSVTADGQGGWKVTVPPGETVRIPLSSAAMHAPYTPKVEAQFRQAALKDAEKRKLSPEATKKLVASTLEEAPTKFMRNGSAMANYRIDVAVVSGDPKHVAVNDIARHPNTAVKLAENEKLDQKHHQGVFMPQVQTRPPLRMAPGIEASLRIQEQGGGHYETAHHFKLQFDPKNLPQTLVFRGAGGGTRPLLGGSTERMKPAGPTWESAQKLGFAEAVKKGWLRESPKGSGIYDVTITFKPGDNGMLNVSGQWKK